MWLEGGPCLEEDNICVDFMPSEEGSQRLRDRRKVDAVLSKRLCKRRRV